MPAWTTGSSGTAERGERFLGVKILTVYPENAGRGLASTTATYFLMSGETGFPLAGFDGHALTVWRTAAASALASRYLSRADASRLLVVGAGSLPPCLVRAHASVRPLRDIAIWNRTPARAEKLAARLRAEGFHAEAVTDLEAAARSADIISCATLSTAPLIKGDWLKEGAHLDLVGGFTPSMREADDRAAARARVYVDTRAALAEAGDIAGPIAHGALRVEDIRGDLTALCSSRVPGREEPSEITLFKSVGTAIEDLAAAALLWEKLAPAGAVDKMGRAVPSNRHA
jgi:ornithine cyclodeaminase